MTTPTLDRVTSRDGATIVFHTSGRGRPLVLVHGTTADHTRWRPLLPRLEPHITVVAMDRRGRGASGDGPAYALEREFEDVAAVVDAVSDAAGTPVDLFGHSYGALCAMGAARLTGSVRRLVLYEPPVFDDPATGTTDVLERLDHLIQEGHAEETLTTFFREVVGMAEEELAAFRTLPAWQARLGAAHTIARESREERNVLERLQVPEIRLPTLLLLGEVTAPFLIASTHAVDAALPDSRVALLPGQAHVAIDTATDLVADTVLDFLGHPVA